MDERIVEASTEADYLAFGDMVREYVGWLQQRYVDVPGLIDGVGAHQALDAELEHLSEAYGPPEGKTLLATRDGQVVGVVAYHDLHDGTCEMKRMYVPERFQGGGTGRRLCQAVIASATADGYRLMRLDTGFRNTEAIAMYETLGFRECAPYTTYPDHLAAYLRFMELELVDRGEDVGFSRSTCT